MLVSTLQKKVLEGGQLTREEAIKLSELTDKIALYKAAGEIRNAVVTLTLVPSLMPVPDDVRKIVNGVLNLLSLRRIYRSMN